MTTVLKTKGRPDLDELIAGVLANLPNRDDPAGPFGPVLALAARARQVEKWHREIVGELAKCTADSPAAGAPTVRYDPAADIEAIIEGTDPRSLSAPVAESRRNSLLRQLRATTPVPDILRERMRLQTIQIVGEQFSKLRPLLRDIVAEILKRYSDLLAGLSALKSLDEELNRRGLACEAREQLFLGYDAGILGGHNGQPSLQWHIDDRKKRWRLNGEQHHG